MSAGSILVMVDAAGIAACTFDHLSAWIIGAAISQQISLSANAMQDTVLGRLSDWTESVIYPKLSRTKSPFRERLRQHPRRSHAGHIDIVPDAVRITDNC